MWIGFETALGDAWVAWRDTRLVGLGLPGAISPDGEPAHEGPRWVMDLRRDLTRYFAGEGPLPAVPRGVVLPRATPFASAVRRVVSSIPAGSTMTYSEVAAAAGRPGAARAVGAVNANNPVAPLVPCHRVVGADGSMRGYAGGIDLKQRLIDMEAGDA